MNVRVTEANTSTVVEKTTVRWKIFLAILGLMAVNYIDRASLSVAGPFNALYMTRSESIASTPPTAMR